MNIGSSSFSSITRHSSRGAAMKLPGGRGRSAFFVIVVLVATVSFLILPPWLRNRAQRRVMEDFKGRTYFMFTVRYTGPHWLLRFASDDFRAKYTESDSKPTWAPLGVRDCSGVVGIDALIQTYDVVDMVMLDAEIPGKRDDLLSHLAQVHTLKQVIIASNEENPQWDWSRLSALHELQALHLHPVEMKISKKADEILRHVGKCESLRTLMVPPGRVTDAGVAELRNLTNLEELSLSGPQITDASIAILKLLPRLRKVDLRNTNVSKEGAAELRRSVNGIEVAIEADDSIEFEEYKTAHGVEFDRSHP
jgi:hypothetical protein